MEKGSVWRARAAATNLYNPEEEGTVYARAISPGLPGSTLAWDRELSEVRLHIGIMSSEASEVVRNGRGWYTSKGLLGDICLYYAKRSVGCPNFQLTIQDIYFSCFFFPFRPRLKPCNRFTTLR